MIRAAVVLLALAITVHVARAADIRPPNVVVVLFDDLGYGQAGCYREQSGFRTPHLDRLAREGMRFTDAHAAASVCTPTRYGLLTGRYPCRIGQYGVLTTYSPPIVPATRMTVASLLRAHGYDTACIGKWHLGMTWDDAEGRRGEPPVGSRIRSGPEALGFDLFCGVTHSRAMGTIIEHDRVVARVEPVETQPRLAHRAVAYLDDPARVTKPFFLYLPISPPHTPIVPVAEFAGTGGAEGAYGDWLHQGDDVLGQVLAALDRNGLADGTLVFVSSDNGAAGRSYEPLRGAKTSIYEGGHREPFVARWPGRVKAGTVCRETICLNDLLATFADAVGATLPDDAGEDSVSILPALLGTARGPLRETTVHQSPKGDLAIRHGRWKLIFFRDGGRELYDLENDIGETQDRVADEPEVVADLTGRMRRLIAEGRSTKGAVQKNDAALSIDSKAPRDGRRRRRDS